MKKLSLSLVALATATTVFGAGFQLEQICNGSGALTASETEIAKKFPIGDCNALGKSRGGNLDDIDAINDGTGSFVLAPMGQNISSTQAKMRNTKFIEAVRKHGAKAKDDAKGIVSYLNDNSVDTEALVREADAKDGDLTPAAVEHSLDEMVLLVKGPTRNDNIWSDTNFKNHIHYTDTTRSKTMMTKNFQKLNSTVYAGDGRHFVLNSWQVVGGSASSYGQTDIFKLFTSNDNSSWTEILHNSARRADGYSHTYTFNDLEFKYLKIISYSTNPYGFGHIQGANTIGIKLIED